MMKSLTNAERSYLLWLDAGQPGGNVQLLPQSLVERGLVEVVEREPRLTWNGSELAKAHRKN
jgi:hypothetical protein